MAGLFFVLLAIFIAWFLFLKGPLEERSSLDSELNSLSEASSVYQKEVVPTSETIAAAKYASKSPDSSEILKRISDARLSSRLVTKNSASGSVINIYGEDELMRRKTAFLAALQGQIGFTSDGQIENPEQIPWIEIRDVTITPQYLKASVNK